METSKTAQFGGYISSEVVSIYVGPKRKEYHVHKKLLCEKSSYFASALEGGFKEGQEGKMYQPDETPEVFDLFVRWIYTGDLAKASWDLGPTSAFHFFDLHILADKLCMKQLKNLVMDKLWALTEDGSFNASAVGRVYCNMMPGSLLRKFIAYQVALDIKLSNLLSESSDERAEKMVEELGKNGDFAFDVVFALDKLTGAYCNYDVQKERLRFHEA